MVAVIRTLGRVLAGFLAACVVAGVIQVMFVDTPKELAALPASEISSQGKDVLELSLLTATHFALFSVTFALIAAGIAEWLSVRALGYWLAAGTGIALLGFIAQYSSEVAGQPSIFNNYALQAYLTAGFFAGLVYWLIAGARSGEAHGAAELARGDAAIPAPKITVEKSVRNDVAKGSLAERLSLKRAKSDAAAAAPPQPAAPLEVKPASAQATVPDGKATRPPAPVTSVPVTRSEQAKTSPAAAKPRGNTGE